MNRISNISILVFCRRSCYFLELSRTYLKYVFAPPFSTIDWSAFDRECIAHLPAYARPAFIRITAIMQLTSTFKHQKTQLAQQGYELNAMSDDIFFYSVRDHTVTTLTPLLVQQIQTGDVQL